VLAVNPEAVLRTREPAVVSVESMSSLPPDATCSWCLTEKSVSPCRTLDKWCYVHHTVVYLIRYAIL